MNVKLVAAVIVTLILALGLFLSAWAEKPFLDLVGNVPVGEVTQTAPLAVPYITWGGDVATFYPGYLTASGILKAAPGIK